MIVIAIIAVVGAIAIPGLLAAQRASNERNASASLKAIVTAEADFRSNDRDGNRLSDFWTCDVYALYGLTPLTGGATSPGGDTSSAAGIIKLIDATVAGADCDTDHEKYDNVSFGDSIVTGSPKAGYVYRKFESQDDGAGPVPLENDTDGADYYTDVHDRTRFAFMAAPESLSSGKLLFIVNADNTLWKYNVSAGYTMTYTPMTGTADSESTIIGTGHPFMDEAAVFPASPGSIGCSKMD